MKKFVKGSLITALITFILGIIIVILCIIWGSHRIVKDVTDANLPSRINTWLDKLWEYEDIKWKLSFSDVESSVHYNSDYPIHSGVHTNYLAAPLADVDNISISMDGGELLIQPSEDDNFQIEAVHCKNLQYYAEDGTFYLNSGFETTKDVTCQVTLKVPVHQYNEIAISVGAGNLEYTNLTADNAAITLGAGAITINGLEATTLSSDIGVGALCITDASTVDTTIHVGIGGIEYEGIITGELNSTCSTGSIDLTLNDHLDQHNYYMTCSLGNIELDHSSYSGHVNKDIEHDSDSNYYLNCSLGEIVVDFE
ncbi:MAG: DUF4097 family beta strand repeat protein [Lachnospiraceae bacterium]|nr:DUF4097 family beta strand repeat protein [Lachnospiraceae bacterium]